MLTQSNHHIAIIDIDSRGYKVTNKLRVISNHGTQQLCSHTLPCLGINLVATTTAAAATAHIVSPQYISAAQNKTTNASIRPCAGT
jgi:hypothetical protein